LETSLGFARKSDNECGAQSQAWDARTYPVDQLDDIFLRSFATHPLQHVQMNVLQRHIHIAGDLRTFCYGFD